MTLPERADYIVPVPRSARRWSAERAQEWARNEVLFGGPPAKPEDPSTGAAFEWASIKNRVGTRVRIKAQPMGLIFTRPDGSRRYVPGDATTGTGREGFSLGVSVSEMRNQGVVEASVRAFAREEVERYNKRMTAKVRSLEGRTATYEFWQAGKRIRTFIRSSGTSQDRVWFSLEQWGRGANGYGKAWLEGATYLYDWLPEVDPSHPICAVSETRTMNIIRCSSHPEVRDRLLRASLEGPLQGVSDEEFKWITGQSPGTFPGSPNQFSELRLIGESIQRGQVLNPDRAELLSRILSELRTRPTNRGSRRDLAAQNETYTDSM